MLVTQGILICIDPLGQAESLETAGHQCIEEMDIFEEIENESACKNCKILEEWSL